MPPPHRVPGWGWGRGRGPPQEPTCAPSPRSQRRGRRAGTRRLGGGGASCPAGIPPALLTTARAGHARSARILRNWASRSRTPRLGMRWQLWSSSVLPSFTWGSGASGLREGEGLPIPGGGAQGEGGAYAGMGPEGGASVGGARCGRGSGLRAQRSGRGSGRGAGPKRTCAPGGWRKHQAVSQQPVE